MPSVGSRRAACLRRLNQQLGQRLFGRAIISIHAPVRLSNYSEPEPDLALLKLRADFYAARHPEPEDILLVIEVVDSRTEPDWEVNLPLYARSGIPEVGLVVLEEGAAEIYRRPTHEGYEEVRPLLPGRPAALQAFPDVHLSIEDVFG